MGKKGKKKKGKKGKKGINPVNPMVCESAGRWFILRKEGLDRLDVPKQCWEQPSVARLSDVQQVQRGLCTTNTIDGRLPAKRGGIFAAAGSSLVNGVGTDRAVLMLNEPAHRELSPTTHHFC